MSDGVDTGTKVAGWYGLGVLAVLPYVVWAWWMLSDTSSFLILGPVTLTLSLFVGTIFVFMGFRLGLRHMYIWTVLLILSFTVVSPVFWLFNHRAVLRALTMPGGESMNASQ